MNIRSVTAQAVPQPPQTNTPTTPTTTPNTAGLDANADSYQPAQNESLVKMLQEQPDVRPEAVERAKNLAADPNYPGSGAIEGLAKMFIADAGEK
jgi:hypothetical protein